MTERQKRAIKFILVDTAGWIILISAIILGLFVVFSFIFWSSELLSLIWMIKGFIFRMIVVISLLLALLGGWSSNFRG